MLAWKFRNPSITKYEEIVLWESQLKETERKPFCKTEVRAEKFTVE